jgi:hypothetical protein
MAKVPAGIFLMGASHARGNPEERPAHEAPVATFFFDKTEVTAAAYRRCVAAGQCLTSRGGSRFCTEHDSKKQNHPINCIDLRMAASYCAFANKRLPTEREWEYAASGGSKQQRYSWGNTPEPSGKISCYGHPGTCEVGIFPPGAFDLHDVSGGVWEWTQSRYLPYPSRGTIDPIEQGKLYVYRGGSWSRRFSKWLRTALRNRYRPDKSSGSIGVRCAKSHLPLQCPPDTKASDGECKRARGIPLCEKNYSYNPEAKKCLPQGMRARQQGRPRPPRAATAGPAAAAKATSSAPAANAAITRRRTPQFDADCQKYWPGTKTSWMFTGGPNFPSRMPKLRSYGCKPRDMGWKWTSACCP